MSLREVGAPRGRTDLAFREKRDRDTERGRGSPQGFPACSLAYFSYSIFVHLSLILVLSFHYPLSFLSSFPSFPLPTLPSGSLPLDPHPHPRRGLCTEDEVQGHQRGTGQRTQRHHLPLSPTPVWPPQPLLSPLSILCGEGAGRRSKMVSITQPGWAPPQRAPTTPAAHLGTCFILLSTHSTQPLPLSAA